MSAPILLSSYRMKKKKDHVVKKESEAPVTLAYMHEFQALMMKQFADMRKEFRQMVIDIEARLTSKIDVVDAKLTAKIDEVDAKLTAKIDEVDAKLTAKIDDVDAKLTAQIKGIDNKVNTGHVNLQNQIIKFDAKLELGMAKLDTSIQSVRLLVEEQNVRNKQAHDGYALAYGAVQDLKRRIKPECLE